MNWVVIAIIALAVVVVILILIKLRLRKRLNDIDGVNGTHRGKDNIIASLGDDIHLVKKK